MTLVTCSFRYRLTRNAVLQAHSTFAMLKPRRAVLSLAARQLEQAAAARRLSTGTPPVLLPYTPRGGPRTSRSGRSSRQDPHPGPQYEPPDPGFQAGQGFGFGTGGNGGSPFSPFGAGNAGGYSANPASIPVHIPSDPEGVLRETDGATRLLGNSALVIVRQLEMLNVFMGFEQANRYAILSPQGDHVG